MHDHCCTVHNQCSRKSDISKGTLYYCNPCIDFLLQGSSGEIYKQGKSPLQKVALERVATEYLWRTISSISCQARAVHLVLAQKREDTSFSAIQSFQANRTCWNLIELFRRWEKSPIRRSNKFHFLHVERNTTFRSEVMKRLYRSFVSDIEEMCRTLTPPSQI